MNIQSGRKLEYVLSKINWMAFLNNLKIFIYFIKSANIVLY